jgi:hypothetical protein
MSKGIIIVATGNAHYGRLAYNLAVSIKSVEDFPIAVLYNGSALSHIGSHQIGVFDYVIEMDEWIAANQGSKMYCADYTPFSESLLLDADMLWLPNRKPSELFEELKDVDFTGITEGKDTEPAKNYFFWADVGEIREVYGVAGDIYQWRTEVVYFNEKGKEIIRKANEITNNPRLKSIKLFAYTVADELGINIAAAMAGVAPHVYKWKASYWHLMNGNIIPEPKKLYDEYYLLSLGGNVSSGTIRKFYDSIMKASCYKLELQHVFPLKSKREYLKERDKM